MVVALVGLELSPNDERAGKGPALDSDLSWLAALLVFHHISSNQEQLTHPLGHGATVLAGFQQPVLIDLAR